MKAALTDRFKYSAIAFASASVVGRWLVFSVIMKVAVRSGSEREEEEEEEEAGVRLRRAWAASGGWWLAGMLVVTRGPMSAA